MSESAAWSFLPCSACRHAVRTISFQHHFTNLNACYKIWSMSLLRISIKVILYIILIYLILFILLLLFHSITGFIIPYQFLIPFSYLVNIPFLFLRFFTNWDLESRWSWIRRIVSEGFEKIDLPCWLSASLYRLSLSYMIVPRDSCGYSSI